MVIEAEVPEHLIGSANPYPPTSQQCIFFYLRDKIMMQKKDSSFDEQARCIVVGPQVTRVNLITGKYFKAVRVGFEPGGLYRLLGIPMQLLFDEGFDAHQLIGVEAKELTEKLQQEKDHHTLKNLVEEFLLSKYNKLKEALPIDMALKEMIRSDGSIPIEKLAALSCLSLRQFERQCIERIGLQPKLFSRITRFSKAYRLYEADNNLNWTSIAYDCGYYDQMHLIRDFKEFAGVTPRIIKHELSEAPFRMQKDIY